jgi:hypothetical protein
MATLGDEEPFRSTAVSQAYGAQSTTRTSLQRDGLIKKGLIWSPRRGHVAFTVPRFAEFIREFYPLDELESSARNTGASFEAELASRQQPRRLPCATAKEGGAPPNCRGN